MNGNKHRLRVVLILGLVAIVLVAWWQGLFDRSKPGPPKPETRPRATMPIASHPATQAGIETIEVRIAPPPGFERVASLEGSFACWLRHLPLKPGRPAVKLYSGKPRRDQNAHHTVIDVDTGGRDLQQSADAIIRLRAEFLFAAGKGERVHFNFLSGERAGFKRWAQGYRPTVTTYRVVWRRSAKPDASYKSFRKYLDTVFTYADTVSLSKELHSVRDIKEMQIGDVFIQARQGSKPGHAVIVLDMAVDPNSGRKLFLLAQGGVPAQDVHVLKNPDKPELSPWYELDFGEILHTPEWSFSWTFLKRFGST